MEEKREVRKGGLKKPKKPASNVDEDPLCTSAPSGLLILSITLISHSFALFDELTFS